jgi:hypothetical protein
MSDLQEEIAHLKEVRRILTERRRWLEQQLAHHGFAGSPVQILLDLDETKQKINATDQQLLQLGEVSYLLVGLNILERLSNLEKELSEVRHLLAVNMPNSAIFPQLESWFKIEGNGFVVHGKNYDFADIVHLDADMYDEKMYGGILEMVQRRVVVSPDDTSVAILVGDFFTPPFIGLLDEDRNTWGKIRLYVFSYDEEEPKFVSKKDQFVHSGPTFSPNGKYIAFAYSHDLQPSKYRSEARDGEVIEYDTVDWQETIGIIGTKEWKLQELFTEEVKNGYGEWSTPMHFFDLAFVKNSTALFGATITDAGILQTWNIPIDGDVPTITPSPRL